jgi:hypothetical protein
MTKKTTTKKIQRCTLCSCIPTDRASCHLELGNYQTAVEDATQATASLSLLIKEESVVEGDQQQRQQE